MKLTKKREAAVLKAYHTYWDSYLNGDMETFASLLDAACHIIGSTAFDVFDDKKSAVDFYTATAGQISGKAEFRNRQLKLLPYQDSVMVQELCDFYFLGGEEWNFYGHSRLSTLLSETETGWKIIHQHGSLPDSRAEEGEQVATEKISQENRELREAVKRRTVELEHKNRELEIEAALERVRTVAMSMNKPDDLLNICEVLFSELRGLGFGELRNAMIHTYFDEKNQFLDYDFSDFSGGCISRIPYSGNSVIERFIQDIRKTSDSFTEFIIAGQQLADWKLFRKSNGEIDDPRLDTISALHYYNYSIGVASIGISTFSPVSDDKRDVLKRFRNVFDFAYKRYTDVAQAEAQAREAKIEVALEKVRSRTMAMQHSGELQDAAMLLFQQVQALGVLPFVCGFNIWDEDKKVATAWMAREDGIEPQFKTSSKEDIYLSIREAAQRGESLFVREQGGEELETHYRYLTSIPEVKAMYEEMLKTGLSWPGFQIMHCAFFSQGYLMFITYEPVPEAHDIFIRFAKVFEQTYTRFLDLQKVEAQAREAKIEVALERVRSRTMSMQHSDELAEVMSVLCKGILNLGIHHEEMETCYITTFDGNKPIGEIYLTYSYGDLLPLSFHISYDEDSFFKQLFTEWRNGNPFFVGHLEGNNLIQHFDFLFSHIPASIIEMRSSGPTQLPSETFTHALCFSQGYLAIVTLKAVPEYHEVFKRFGSTLQQAYTRFLDLQKAEAQAREAKIELSLEKVRNRSMAMHQSHELAEAASVLFQQINELGFEMWSCGFCIWKQDDFSELWMSADSGGLLPPMLMPYKEEPTHHKIYEASLRQEPVHEYIWEGEELKKHYEFLYTIPSVKEAIDILKKSGLSLPAKQCYYVGFFKQGYLLIITKEPTPEMHDLSYRFTKVFEQTYTRFLDLQKAEQLTEQTKLDLIQIQAEKKRAENALTELKATQAQLIQKEKLASLGELTAGIAHEIQNPLNFVNNFSETSIELLDEMKTELENGHADDAKDIANDVIRNLEKINHHGQRADAIVKGMLQHSRSSSGVKELTDINALTVEYIRLTYNGLRRSGVPAKDQSLKATINTDFDKTLDKINVIPQDIGRVIMNLLNNAFYAVQQKHKQAPHPGYEPTITVSTKKMGDTVCIRVEDNGNGIPPQIRDKIFQPFFTTKPTGEGTGLGLSLSYDIVTKGHGGSLTVSSSQSQLTEFLIRLPV